MKIKPLNILMGVGITAVCIGGWIGTAYGIVTLGQLPIDLPGKPVTEEIVGGEPYNALNYPTEGYDIARQWEDVVIYKPRIKVSTVEELIDVVELPEITEDELFIKFDDVEETSLLQFLSSNPQYLENGYEKMFIDMASKDEVNTGIKTTNGDEVQTIDSINGIIIANRKIENPSGTCNAKIAIVKNPAQLDLSVPDKQGIWEIAKTHANKHNALLAINANGYTWNESGSYAVMFGGLKIDEDYIRKPNDKTQTVCIDNNGYLTIGEDPEITPNLIEMGPVLIKDGAVVYTLAEGETEDRYAQTAIGQREDGTLILVVASGSTYGAGIGANTSEILKIMQDYKCTNASMMSGGSRSVMYWNDRVLNDTIGYNTTGVRLPVAIVIKPSSVALESAEQTILGGTPVEKDDGILTYEDEHPTETSNTEGTGESGAVEDVVNGN